MTASAMPNGRCHVTGSEKLSASAGGADALCTEVAREISKLAPGTHYSAEINVVSKSKLTAILIVNGRTLPAQKFAIMDSELDVGAIQRFAVSLAREVAKAAKS